jgi:hypothetical protein
MLQLIFNIATCMHFLSPNTLFCPSCNTHTALQYTYLFYVTTSHKTYKAFSSASCFPPSTAELNICKSMSDKGKEKAAPWIFKSYFPQGNTDYFYLRKRDQPSDMHRFLSRFQNSGEVYLYNSLWNVCYSKLFVWSRFYSNPSVSCRIKN